MNSLAQVLGIENKVFDTLYSERYRLGNYYRVFTIPKKSGGKRIICRPIAELRIVQRKIYDILLKSLKLPPCCHGFRAGFSTLTNANQHVRQQCVIKLDIKDFFPSVTTKQVYGLWSEIRQSPKDEIDFLTQLTTLNNQLPQGAPTSPCIANLICRTLDKRLSALSSYFGASYTRYADDLTFSGNHDLQQIIPTVSQIISQEGFSVASNKSKVYGRASRQTVTGLVVNDRATVPREVRRNLRAAFHNLGTGKTTTWNHNLVNADFLLGYLSYIRGVHPYFLDEIAVQNTTDKKPSIDISELI